MEEQLLLTDTAPATTTPLPDITPGMVIRRTPDGPREFVVYNHQYNGSHNQLLTVAEDGKDRSEYQKLDTSYTTVPREDHTWRPVLAGSKAGLLGYSGHTTVGSDPEIFVLDRNGDVLPAFVFLPPKESRIRVHGGNNDAHQGDTFYDGFQAEWTTTPGNCSGYHMDRVRAGMQRVLLEARKADPAATLTIASTVPIPREMVPNIDPRHFQLGCAPSENVYGDEHLSIPDPMRLPFRSAGWHMHIKVAPYDRTGRTNPDINMSSIPRSLIHSAIRMMDRVLGVAMVSFGQHYQYPERRTLYGRAGEYRFGNTLEYRVPEVLLGAHPATWNLLWDLGRNACWLGLKGYSFLWDAEDDEVRHAINKGDVDVAQRILRRNEPMLRKMIAGAYAGYPGYMNSRVEHHSLATIYEGIDYAVAEPTNLVKNWKLDGAWKTEYDGHTPDTFWSGTCGIIQSGTRV